MYMYIYQQQAVEERRDDICLNLLLYNYIYNYNVVITNKNNNYYFYYYYIAAYIFLLMFNVIYIFIAVNGRICSVVVGQTKHCILLRSLESLIN